MTMEKKQVKKSTKSNKMDELAIQTIEQYEMKIKLMLFDFKTIVEALNKAESIVKLIADDYRLPEAQGYFDDASK